MVTSAPNGPSEGDRPRTVTIAEFRDVFGHLDGEIPVVVAVRDQHSFNTLLAAIPIAGVSVTPGPNGPVVVLDVVTVT